MAPERNTMKSPIETQLVQAIRAQVPAATILDDYTLGPSLKWLPKTRQVHFKVDNPNGPNELDGDEYGTERDKADRWIGMYADVEILTYRADILIAVDGNDAMTEWLAVECDGHDFHDRTKQQAAYDRARDRELLAQGVYTIRFTGSEIHHDSHRCAVETWGLIEAIYERSIKTMHAWMAGYEAGQKKKDPVRPLLTLVD
jgi:hypothetical protein